MQRHEWIEKIIDITNVHTGDYVKIEAALQEFAIDEFQAGLTEGYSQATEDTAWYDAEGEGR